MEYSLIPRAETVREVLALNRETARYGLTLTAEQAAALTQTQRQALRDTGRIQFRGGTLERLIALFCDSPYIAPDEWERTLHALLELFVVFGLFLGGAAGMAEKFSQGGFGAILLLVGLGTAVHSCVDYAVSVLVWRPIRKVGGVAAISAVH